MRYGAIQSGYFFLCKLGGGAVFPREFVCFIYNFKIIITKLFTVSSYYLYQFLGLLNKVAV